MPDNAYLSDYDKKREFDSLSNIVGLDCSANAVRNPEKNDFSRFFQQPSPFIDFPETNLDEITKHPFNVNFGNKLPPLATLFTQESGRNLAKMEFFSINDESYSLLNVNSPRFQDPKRINYAESHERGVAPRPMHVNHSEQTMNASSAAYQIACDANTQTNSCEKNRSILRKRQHHRFQDNSLPPNVNAAFKVGAI